MSICKFYQAADSFLRAEKLLRLSIIISCCLSLCGSALEFANLENDASAICIANATFHIDCNRCRCSPSGMSMDCSDWSCATLQIPHDLLLNLTVNCTPGEIFVYNSDKCLCGVDNQALCTSAHYELAHNLRPTSGKVIAKIDTADTCTPGVVFKQGCDTCICDESGTDAACLGIECVERSRSVDDSPTTNWTEKVCVPCTSFSLDCNQCICSSDGLSILCDPYPCLGVEMREDQLLNITFRCEASTTFVYNSHECLCSSSGNYALCSLMPHLTDYERKALRESAGMQVFSIADFPDLCTPGTTFKLDDCNVCVCGRKERAACTRMDCEWRRWATSEARKRLSGAGEIVTKQDVWVQRPKNPRYCRRHFESTYCRYLRNY